MGVGGQSHTPTVFPLGQIPSTHRTEGWVGLDICGKPRSPRGFDLPTVQLVVSRYNDYAFPAHILCGTFITYDVYGADSSSSFRLHGLHHDTHTHTV
jgi:hypothetical protein